MVNEQAYHRGRSDALRKLPANPGQGTPEQYNHYMSGYNSVHQTTYQETLQSIIEIVENHRARSTKEGLALVLSKLLIKSLGEPAEIQTETDAIFKDYLDLLENHEAYELKKGFAELYNAVQKSKRFVIREGEITKYLKHSKPVEEQKEKPKKKSRKN